MPPQLGAQSIRLKTMPRRLRPVGQRGVEQVVRAGPDVEEDQRPEVDDRQPVGEDRPFGRLRQEVVHDAEDRRGQEEGDRVVAVPPLHERVLHAGEDRSSSCSSSAGIARLLTMCSTATVTIVAM